MEAVSKHRIENSESSFIQTNHSRNQIEKLLSRVEFG